MILDAQWRSTRELKPKHEWNKADNENSKANVRASFGIFNRVCLDEFHKITNCKHAKEAWDIFQVTYEGKSATKISKLQILTTKFKNISMHENQTFFFLLLWIKWYC